MTTLKKTLFKVGCDLCDILLTIAIIKLLHTAVFGIGMGLTKCIKSSLTLARDYRIPPKGTFFNL